MDWGKIFAAYTTVRDLKVSQLFQKKKLWESVTLWENLPKWYYFVPIKNRTKKV